jgi:SNF2 family DNA or RNA helicase
MNAFCLLGLIKPTDMEALNYTSKLDAIIDLLVRRKNNGKGKIIFCHFQKEIDVIAYRLKENGFEKVVTYDGRNSGGKNLANLANPADALIIQIQTGCEGLNLQHHFSEIYFVSPHWNPCVEDQAIARCHRIGQTNPVNVFKFEMNGFKNTEKEPEITGPNSLEKYVNYVQDLKRVISKEILSHANTTAQ